MRRKYVERPASEVSSSSCSMWAQTPVQPKTPRLPGMITPAPRPTTLSRSTSWFDERATTDISNGSEMRSRTEKSRTWKSSLHSSSSSFAIADHPAARARAVVVKGPLAARAAIRPRASRRP
jgi:hypothetical protein